MATCVHMISYNNKLYMLSCYHGNDGCIDIVWLVYDWWSVSGRVKCVVLMVTNLGCIKLYIMSLQNVAT